MQNNQDFKKLIKSLAQARYYSKRCAGISATRSDGSQCSVNTDENATAAEYVAASLYNRPFNAEIGSRGDGGADFAIPLRFEVIWLGVQPNGEPRESGHLIINPHEPQRWADIYIVMKGSLDKGFEELGWMPHNILKAFPKKDFGFGPRFACSTDQLKNPKLLKNLFLELGL